MIFLTFQILFVESNLCMNDAKMRLINVNWVGRHVIWHFERCDKRVGQGLWLEVDVSRLLFFTVSMWCGITHFSFVTFSTKSTCYYMRLFWYWILLKGLNYYPIYLWTYALKWCQFMLMWVIHIGMHQWYVDFKCWHAITVTRDVNKTSCLAT